MASRAETMQYLVDQLSGLPEVSTRRMFGEYAIYLQGKVIGFICDDQFYLKPTDAGKRLLESPQLAAPWVGAKKYLLIIDELEQRDLLRQLVQVTANALPLPKPKAIKVQKASTGAKKPAARPVAKAAPAAKRPAKAAAKQAKKTVRKITSQ